MKTRERGIEKREYAIEMNLRQYTLRYVTASIGNCWCWVEQAHEIQAQECQKIIFGNKNAKQKYN